MDEQISSEIVDDLTPIALRASSLRAYYGRQGKLVYDRYDRWIAEHSHCKPDSHVANVESCMYTIHCGQTNSVAVCESWQFRTRRE